MSKCIVMNCREEWIGKSADHVHALLCERHAQAWIESGERVRWIQVREEHPTPRAFVALNDFLQRMQFEDQRAIEIPPALRSDTPREGAEDFDVTYPRPEKK